MVRGLPRLDHPQRLQIEREVGPRVGEEEVVGGAGGKWAGPGTAKGGEGGALPERFVGKAAEAEAAVGWAEHGCVHGE